LTVKWSSWQFGETGSLLYRTFDSLRRRLDRNLVRFLVGNLSQGKDKVLMEAGSGPAYASSLFANVPGVRLSIALDIDPAVLVEARRRDRTIPAVIADLYKLPFKSSSFDLIWNSSTMEHLEDPLPALLEISRLLKQDGHIFIGVPSLHGPLALQKLIPHTSVGIWIGKVFDHEALKNLLQSAGFCENASLKYFLNFFIGVFGEKVHPEPSNT
jgi:SAM-dependent methyltransferase